MSLAVKGFIKRHRSAHAAALRVERLLRDVARRVSERRSDHPLAQVRRLLHEARLPARATVLDVGGGEARYRSELSRSAGRHVAVDRRDGAGVAVVADAHALPFADGSVDSVLVIDVLEHVRSPHVVLQECSRVLEDGGTLLLSAPQYWHTHGWPSDFYRFTREGLIHLCEGSGFVVWRIWSRGGPFLVVCHAIELNLPFPFRQLFTLLFYALSDLLDRIVFGHEDRRPCSDSVGWSLVARKEKRAE